MVAFHFAKVRSGRVLTKRQAAVSVYKDELITVEQHAARGSKSVFPGILREDHDFRLGWFSQVNRSACLCYLSFECIVFGYQFVGKHLAVVQYKVVIVDC